MDVEDTISDDMKVRDNGHQTLTICLHAFSDLTHVSPVVFLYLLKECYTHGTSKATKKFRALQQLLPQLLCPAQPGPASFIIHCLYVLPIFGLYSEGLSHLILSALRRFTNLKTASEDMLKAKCLAVQLFLDIVGGFVDHDERILVKILEIFNVTLTDIKNSMCQLETEDHAISYVEQYVLKLQESESYMTAIALLEHFHIRQSGNSLLLMLMQNKQYKAAERWADFMGKSMLCLLVQEYVDRNMMKQAYEIIKKNNLRDEFPDLFQTCKESSLKSLAEKALWDLAEQKTKGERQLLEYLVYLAMEAGYSEKVDELCNRYSLQGFVKAQEPEENLLNRKFLELNDLSIEDIIWVDEVDGLCSATRCIESCKVIGLDCEWKPNYVKGIKPNKVSILQIGTDRMVFIFDLIKLHEDVPYKLDDCLSRILQSPTILKLGYNFQCDIKQLAQSYGNLKCFKHYQMLLDIQKALKNHQGGLSGLSEKILGVGLSKTRRNSDWESRPLRQNQLEYAALDAAVLVRIFSHLRNHSEHADGGEHQVQSGWKSHIVSHMGTPKKAKKKSKITKEEGDKNHI